MLKEKRKKRRGVGKWEKVTATTEAGNAKKKRSFSFCLKVCWLCSRAAPQSKTVLLITRVTQR